MNFTDYWDKRLEEWEKAGDALLGKTQILNIAHEEAANAWDAALAEKEKQLEQFLKDVSDDMECLPSCDSVAHDELCPKTNTVVAWRQLRDEIAEKDRDCERLKNVIDKYGINLEFEALNNTQALGGEKK
jgi:hypothetical protein